MNDTRIDPCWLTALKGIANRTVAGSASIHELQLITSMLPYIIADLEDMHDYVAGLEADTAPPSTDLETTEIEDAIQNSDNVQVLGCARPEAGK